MRIEAAMPRHTPAPDRRAAANEHLQSVFSEILQQAGHDGYASAQPHPSQHTLEHDIRQGWSEWFSAATENGAYASRADDWAAMERDYGEIVVRAWREGGYHDPSGFLRRLGDEDLEAVRRVHLLAQPIDPGTLSEEGALNLLIPPPAQVDMNRDGITRVGQASTLRFPDSLTPPSVVDAWNDATAGMDLRDKMIYQFQMKAPTLMANLDPATGRRREPGDPGFRNPMAEPTFSYVGLTQQHLDSLAYFRHQMPREQYERQSAFWTDFQQKLRAYGAP